MLAATLSLTLAQLSFVPADGGAMSFPARRLVPLTVEGGVAVRLDGRGFRIIWADQRRALGGGSSVTDLFTSIWSPDTGQLERPTGGALVLNPDGRHTRNPVLASDPAGLLLMFDEVAGSRSSLRGRSLAPAQNVDGGSASVFTIAQGSLEPAVGSASLVHDGVSFVAGWWVGATANSHALAFQRLSHIGTSGDAGLETWVTAVPTGGPFLAGERSPITVASNWNAFPTAHTSSLGPGTATPVRLVERTGRVVGVIANGGNDPTVLLESDAGLLLDFDAPTLVYASSISPGQRVPTQWAGARVVALIHRPLGGWHLGVLNPGQSGLVNTTWPRSGDGGTLRPIALAGDGGLFPIGLELQQNVLFVRTIAPDAGTFVPAAGATLVSQTGALQRDPSVVWSVRDNAFLVAFSEYTDDRRWETLFSKVSLDGASTTPQPFGNLPPSSAPGRPRVLRRPSGQELALLVDQTATVSALFELSAGPGGYAVGQQLGPSQPSNVGGALGDNGELLWNQSVVAVGFTSSNLLWTAPSCAAFTNGAHWLFGFVTPTGQLMQLRLDDAVSHSSSQLFVAGLTGDTPVCATSVSDRLIGVFETRSGSVAAFSVEPGAVDAGLVPLVGYREFDGGAGATRPRAVPFGESALFVGWESPEGVNAAILSDAGVMPLSLDSRRAIDAKNLALATSPTGVVAVAWQEFDRAALTTQVQVRLFVPAVDGGSTATQPDGGVQPVDAGQVGDGGLDGGSAQPDGGVQPIDAGRVEDGGAEADGGLDAGLDVDGGRPDDGGVAGGDGGPAPGQVVLIPVSCGCSAEGGALTLLAAWLLRRRQRRIRLSRGPS
ncbi:MAG: hypothetical protein JNJ54_12320 [Myxococcaceae bacterium]|nr:hypothetical protein [Myxococcaceae bacterium]